MLKRNESETAHWVSRLMMSLLLFQTACNSPHCTQEQSTTGVRDTGSGSAPSSQTQPLLPTATTSAAAAVRSNPPTCAVRIHPAKFIECKPPQHGDLECWFYTIRGAGDPNEGKDSCIPSSVLIDLSGGQANANVLRVHVDYDNFTRPHHATLILVRVESSLTSFDVKPGTQLGTLIFENGHVSELRFGPGLLSQTGVRSLRAEPDD